MHNAESQKRSAKGSNFKEDDRALTLYSMGNVIRGDEDGTKPAELEPVSWRIALYDQGLSSHQSDE